MSPWVAGLIDTFTDPIDYYFLLECSFCGTLQDLMIEHGAIPEKHVHFYAVNILSAIDVLNDHRIVHADIKPDNILVGFDGYLSLCNFGGAKDLNETSRSRWLNYPGNLYYIAPELFGFGTVPVPSYTVDFWALGVIIFELATGVVPFLGANDDEVYAQIRHGIKYPDQNKNYLMQHATAQLLQFDPKKRLGYIDHAREIFEHRWFAGTGARTFLIRQRQASPPTQPTRDDVTRLWHTKPLPRVAEVPGLHIVQPPAELRYYKRWRVSAADGPHVPFEPLEGPEEAEAVSVQGSGA